jgi:hypothetical protein
MPEMTVNNPNIVVVASSKQPNDAKSKAKSRSESYVRRNQKVAIIRRIERAKRRLEEITCTSTWAEDCLFRGEEYAPDFKCKCPLCREIFRRRLHPRPVRESNYSLDCQAECNEDPELAEDLARLRNERLRVGSVFVGNLTRATGRDKSSGR